MGRVEKLNLPARAPRNGQEVAPYTRADTPSA